MTPAAPHASPDSGSRFQPSRRMVFHGLGALGAAAALAGCGGNSDSGAVDSPTTPSTSDSEDPTNEPTADPSTEPTDQPTASASEKATALATTAEIPVGGGIVLFEEQIVLTQPEEGRFEAFSAICKHQGEIVGVVENGTITCTFHGSQYDAATGEVTGGPAPSGLDPIEIRVVKGEIVLA